ncbi:MAG: MBL fold metallo-hydrolase [Calditrichota bacterium]
MKYCVLASGSKGNSLYIETHHGRFLIDVGLSAKKIADRLASRDIDPAGIDAILVTHSHQDHVKGVGVFSRRYNVPIYAAEETLEQLASQLRSHQELNPITDRFTVKDVTFEPFEVSHDCEPTVGYVVKGPRSVLVQCTDLGYASRRVKDAVLQANALLLESNYDEGLLASGPYPWQLKERISGNRGHLSNKAAAELLRECLTPRLKHVILGHLSDENNTPDHVTETMRDVLGSANDSLYQVIVQQTVSDVFQI